MLSRAMRAEIIAVGTELLTSSRLDTNSLFITRRLNESGLRVMRKFVVGDRDEEIRGSLEMALRDSEVVITIGGLGPTHDDITREVVSEALGRDLELDSALVSGLKARFRRAGLKITENNFRQARVPAGAEPIENPNGTAPGLFLREGKALVFLLPGPPRELEPMMDQVMECIRQHKQLAQVFHRHLKVASQSESVVDSTVGPIYKSYPQIETTILSSPGMIELDFYWVGEANQKLAESQLDELQSRLAEQLGESLFTDQEEGLEEVVGRILRESGQSLATAESCTGGLIGKMLTDVPGSSEYYRGGVVCYSNSLKVDLVGVDRDSLERFGAVSQPVAHQMAVGIRESTGADFGLSVTGIAGPDGSTPEKPVGLVFIGLSHDQETQVRQERFPGNREAIRMRASRYALDWLRRTLLTR
ncbi:MAG: competence/damage-inducible protein A [Acidobacteria bacterium]|nr:competence/damage-inducible protein A [Acidobacteriota bacterium]